MARNSDGTVTTKVKGKLASTPSGTGTALTRLSTTKSTTRATPAGLAKQPGRKAVGRSAR